jgi:hypothetical protein
MTDTTDRELLELAARAAGYSLKWGKDWHDKGAPLVDDKLWNPLTDDGDAQRLAMHLGMRVSLREAHADGGEIRICDNSDDWMCATRRAIVKAAAEIGSALND